MFEFILAADAQGGAGNSWIMLVVLGVLMVGMILMSIIPQRKRQKQTEEMMAGLKKGDSVCTIGGFVGVIKGIDNGKNTVDIDISSAQDGSSVVTIVKNAISSITNPVPQQNYDESKTVDTNRGESVVTADDMEADKKAKNKKNKKNKNTADEVKADDVKTDEVKSDEVKTDEVKTDEVKTDEVVDDNKNTDSETF